MEPSQPPAQPNQPRQPAPSPTPSPVSTPSKPPRSWGNFKSLLSVLGFVAGIIVAATLINQFIFQSYYVDGTSMTPTLSNNDRLIIDKVERTMAIVRGQRYIPQRGQIVVLDSSLVDQTGHHEQLIKRVIGLPGDTVSITADGVVTIRNQEHPDGFNVDESLGLTDLEATYVDAPINVTIPQGQVFVMGDNRAPGGSFDSRAFGPIGGDKIQGRLVARIFPLNQTKIF